VSRSDRFNYKESASPCPMNRKMVGPTSSSKQSVGRRYLLSLRRIKTRTLRHQALSLVTAPRRRGKQKLQDVVIEREGEHEESIRKR